MPDQEKLKAMVVAGFSLRRTCASCKHWSPNTLRVITSGKGWGRCDRHTYNHMKHSGTSRLGTPGIGWCPEHSLGEAIEEKLRSAFGPLDFVEEETREKSRTKAREHMFPEDRS